MARFHQGTEDSSCEVVQCFERTCRELRRDGEPYLVDTSALVNLIRKISCNFEAGYHHDPADLYLWLGDLGELLPDRPLLLSLDGPTRLDGKPLTVAQLKKYSEKVSSSYTVHEEWEARKKLRDERIIAHPVVASNILQQYKFLLRSRSSCKLCHNSESIDHTAFQLILYVEEEGMDNIEQRLQKFLQKEQREITGKCDNESCEGKMKDMWFEFATFPAVLTICTKAIKGGKISNTRAAAAARKNTVRLQYLSPSLTIGDAEYLLRTSILHVGENTSHGHYYAYTSITQPDNSERWFQMNDTFAREYQLNDVLEDPNCVTCFYEKIK